MLKVKRLIHPSDFNPLLHTILMIFVSFNM